MGTAAPQATGPRCYWNVSDIGAMFGVKAHTVDVWMRRYSPGRTAGEIAKAATFPQPDAYVGILGQPIAGWSPAREDELRAWHAARPGRGAGGGRPRKT